MRARASYSHSRIRIYTYIPVPYTRAYPRASILLVGACIRVKVDCSVFKWNWIFSGSTPVRKTEGSPPGFVLPVEREIERESIYIGFSFFCSARCRLNLCGILCARVGALWRDFGGLRCRHVCGRFSSGRWLFPFAPLQAGLCFRFSTWEWTIIGRSLEGEREGDAESSTCCCCCCCWLPALWLYVSVCIYVLGLSLHSVLWDAALSSYALWWIGAAARSLGLYSVAESRAPGSSSFMNRDVFIALVFANVYKCGVQDASHYYCIRFINFLWFTLDLLVWNQLVNL